MMRSFQWHRHNDTLRLNQSLTAGQRPHLGCRTGISAAHQNFMAAAGWTGGGQTGTSHAVLIEATMLNTGRHRMGDEEANATANAGPNGIAASALLSHVSPWRSVRFGVLAFGP